MRKILFVLILTLFSTQVWAQTEPYSFSFSKLPKHLFEDAQNTLWNHEGVYLLLSLGAAFSFNPLDRPISTRISKDPPLGTSFSKHFGDAISPYTLSGLALASWGASFLIQDPKFSLMTESALESFFWTGASTLALKEVFQRTRPNGENFSFPSLHSSFAFAAATTLTEFYGVYAAIPAYTLAAFTAYTRMDMSKHYLTDVLAGAVIGTAFAIGTAKTHKKHKNEKHTFFYPMVLDKGLGLGFTTAY